MTENEFFKGLN